MDWTPFPSKKNSHDDKRAAHYLLLFSQAPHRNPVQNLEFGVSEKGEKKKKLDRQSYRVLCLGYVRCLKGHTESESL
jgi:hypothetical protein